MFIETVLSPSIANRKPNVTYSGRNLFIIFTNKLRLRYNIYAYYLSYFQYFHHLILSSLNFTARRRDYSCDVQCWNNLNNKKEVATKSRRCRRSCSLAVAGYLTLIVWILITTQAFWEPVIRTRICTDIITRHTSASVHK